MTTDLTGGIDPARELTFETRPDDPEMRDSVSFWVFDDRGELGLPRIGIEAVASNWEHHGIQVNAAFSDGRVFRLREDAPSVAVTGADGLPRVLGAGPLTFTCVREFDTWRVAFDGAAVATSSADLVAGRKDGPWSRCSSMSRRRWPCRRGCRGAAARRGVLAEHLDHWRSDGRPAL